MSEDNGHGVTFELSAGFVDSLHCCPTVEPVWQIIGSIFFLVTFISFVPQTVELVQARSSFGIEPLAIFCQSLGHWLLVVNISCFRALDFVGFFQYPTVRAFPRMLIFMSLFFQWMMFVPTIYQAYIYHDREERPARDRRAIWLEWFKTSGGAILLTTVDLILLAIFVGMSVKFGFESQPVLKYAQTCGTIATLLEFGFFVPQLYTTCKLRDGGSLSLIMLEIQAPADVCNALYMWLGTGDDWTSWLTVMVNGLEEFILLGTCLLFKCIRAREARKGACRGGLSFGALARRGHDPSTCFCKHISEVARHSRRGKGGNWGD